MDTLLRLMSFLRPLRFSILATILWVAPAMGQTVTVTTGNDAIDIDPFSGVISDLPGPDGEVSFSEAMIATNNTPGHQTIAFNIPQSEWQLQWLYPGRAVLKSITGYYWRASDSVTIDGTTQTAFTGDTYADGAEVAVYGAGIFLNADNCTIRGFDHTRITVTGSHGLIESNTEGNYEVWNGSGSLVRGNTGGTIEIDRSSSNVVIGNTVQRVRVLGWNGGGFPAADNRIGGATLAERNFITGYGTWNSEGYPNGTAVQVFDSTRTLIENNWIGTTPDGIAQGNLAATVGVGLEGENHNVVVRGNRIAGIYAEGHGPHYLGIRVGWAILVQGSGDGLDLLGNTIGLDGNDQPRLGSVYGIDVGAVTSANGTMTGVRIGGDSANDGNVIAGNRQTGIVVGRTTSGVLMRSNSMFGNVGLGIDLVADDFARGVSANDALDADGGGNGLQNYPTLTTGIIRGDSTLVMGSFASAPNRSYTLEFQVSPTVHVTGFGEGQLVLGRTTVATDAAGLASFSLALPTRAPVGWMLSATATDDASSSTSEYAAAIRIEGLGLKVPGSLVRGSQADVEVFGAQPGERVYFLYTLAGMGIGPCPPQLGGLCLDLLDPVRILGSSLAGGGGTAIFAAQIPPHAPLVDLYVQAVVRRGQGGVDSEKTDVVKASIQP
jgi:hypothetical protein